MSAGLASAVSIERVVDPVTTPVAGRTGGPASIAYRYFPAGIVRASQVQSMAVPSPWPCPTTFPSGSVTVTDQGSHCVSVPVKWTNSPGAPVACGKYIFGRPVWATARAIDGKSPYSWLPGQVVNPVSRCPEIVRSVTIRPAGYFGFPVERQLNVESGSTCATSRRQASSLINAARAAGEIEAESYVPISATPTEPWLNPCACAPTTFR